MVTQQKYDVYQNTGGGLLYLRRQVQNNPEAYPFSMGPNDYGAVGWTCDVLDVNTATQAIAASGTQYVVEASFPVNCTVTNLSLLLGTTAPATAGTYSGFALYSIGATTATLLSSTGATDSAKWVSAGASGLVTDALATPQAIAAGKYYLSFIAAFTTMPTVSAASIPNANAHSFTLGSATVRRIGTNSTQTSFPSSITLSSLTTTPAFIPFMLAS